MKENPSDKLDSIENNCRSFPSFCTSGLKLQLPIIVRIQSTSLTSSIISRDDFTCLCFAWLAAKRDEKWINFLAFCFVIPSSSLFTTFYSFVRDAWFCLRKITIVRAEASAHKCFFLFLMALLTSATSSSCIPNNIVKGNVYIVKSCLANKCGSTIKDILRFTAWCISCDYLNYKLVFVSRNLINKLFPMLCQYEVKPREKNLKSIIQRYQLKLCTFECL